MKNIVELLLYNGASKEDYILAMPLAKSGTNMPLEETIKMSDILMYENKKRYHDGVTNI